jgi:hypothetical protein
MASDRKRTSPRASIAEELPAMKSLKEKARASPYKFDEKITKDNHFL